MKNERNFFSFGPGGGYIVRTSSVGSCQDVRSRGTVIGATMERYAILRKLGQGTYGSVYLCGKPTPD